MKLKDGVIISEINGEFVAVPSGNAAGKFNGMIRMNRTAAIIAKALQAGKSEDETIAELCEAYDVSEKIAREDYQSITGELDRLGLIDHE